MNPNAMLVPKIKISLADKSKPANKPFRPSPMSPYWSIKSNVPMTLMPHERKKVPTGWIVEVPVGYQLLIFTSSYTAHFGVIVAEAPASYGPEKRTELEVVLINLTGVIFNIIEHQDEIARIQLIKTQPVIFEQVEASELTYPKDR